MLLSIDMSLGETSRRRAHDSIAHSDSGKERRRAQSRVSQAHRAVTDSVGLCSIFNSTNRIEPVFLAPFRLYCKLVRRPGQGCSSAPWAPCRIQPSCRSFTVHHGVWFWLAGFHSNAAATGSLLGGRSSAGGTMSVFLAPSGNRFYDFSHNNNEFL